MASHLPYGTDQDDEDHYINELIERAENADTDGEGFGLAVALMADARHRRVLARMWRQRVGPDRAGDDPGKFSPSYESEASGEDGEEGANAEARQPPG